MPRYGISNAPTKIDFYYQDPGNFGVEWGILVFNYPPPEVMLHPNDYTRADS